MSTLRRSSFWAGVGLTLAAALLRFPGLGEWPPGLYHDEAFNGLDALSVLQGNFPLYFNANNGREPLFIYLVAGSIALLGRIALAIRLVSALIGTLTVLATWLMARAWFSPRVAWISAVIMAVLVWPINLSRIGFRAVLLPLLIALLLWQIGLAWRSPAHQRRHWMAAGALLGLSFYTYLAARFLPLALGVFALYWYVVVERWGRGAVEVGRDAVSPPGLAAGRSSSWMRDKRDMALALGVAIVVAAPLLLTLVGQGELLGRVDQVSIFNPAINHGNPVGSLARNAARTALMFTTQGDFIPRHNVPQRPVFDPLLALAFLAGVVLCLRHWRQPAYALPLLWTGVMVWPTILAEGAPHFLRAVGVLPVICLFPALALDRLGAWRPGRFPSWLGPAAVALVLALALGSSIHDYWGEHASGTAVYYEFETGATEMAAEMNGFLAAHPDGRVVVAQRLWQQWANVRFLTWPTPGLIPLPANTAPSPEDGSPHLFILWPFEENGPALAAMRQGNTIAVREGAMERGDLETSSRLLYVSYQVNGAAPAATAAPQARFGITRDATGAQIALVQATLHPTRDGKVAVELTWAALAQPAVDYTVFLQALVDDKVVAQRDGTPLRGDFPTSTWRPGQKFSETRLLELPWPPDGVEIITGLYDARTQQRLVRQDGEDFYKMTR